MEQRALKLVHGSVTALDREIGMPELGNPRWQHAFAGAGASEKIVEVDRACHRKQLALQRIARVSEAVGVAREKLADDSGGLGHSVERPRTRSSRRFKTRSPAGTLRPP